MSLYGPPPNVSVAEGLHIIFNHYSTPWKSKAAETIHPDISNQSNSTVLTIDGPNFSKMCKEAPELSKYIGRTDIDLIFSKSSPPGLRRIEFEQFLDALLELSIRIYPDEDPTIALANFLAKFIFALFDQPPSGNDLEVIEKIIDELSLSKSQ